VTAANPGTPNNQRITLKRIKVKNVLAPGGATATVSVWAGAAATDAYAVEKTIDLAPGEALEFDPTMIVLEPGESLYAICVPANACNLTADGLRQTE
jgi:hypothetical protein